MDPLNVALIIALWGLVMVAMTVGSALAALFVYGAFRFLRWCFTVTYYPRRR
jgi:uncharacterized protein (DUF2062 family)